MKSVITSLLPFLTLVESPCFFPHLGHFSWRFTSFVDLRSELSILQLSLPMWLAYFSEKPLGLLAPEDIGLAPFGHPQIWECPSNLSSVRGWGGGWRRSTMRRQAADCGLCLDPLTCWKPSSWSWDQTARSSPLPLLLKSTWPWGSPWGLRDFKDSSWDSLFSLL